MKLLFSSLICLLFNNIIFSETLTFGTPFQINSTTPGSSFNKSNLPNVASNNKGEVVAVWQSVLNNGSVNEIRGNVYAASRNASGVWSVEQQINATSGGSLILLTNLV